MIKLLTLVIAGCLTAGISTACHSPQASAESSAVASASENAATQNTQNEEPATPQPTASPAPVSEVGIPAAYMPRAVIYKTNVDVTDHVPVVLNADGTFLSYPAPSDLNAGQTPVALADGWFLDRRGAIGRGTVFLKYTYKEYEALQQAPSPEQLRAAIMPGAKVTEAYRLPILASEARNDTAVVNNLIRSGLSGATRLVP